MELPDLIKWLRNFDACHVIHGRTTQARLNAEENLGVIAGHLEAYRELCNLLDEYVATLCTTVEQQEDPLIQLKQFAREFGQHRLPDLPSVQLKVSEDVFTASGQYPVPWEIYSEAIDDAEARTRVKVNGVQVADIMVYAKSMSALPEEVQAIGAALVWSAIRSVYLGKKSEEP